MPGNAKHNEVVTRKEEKTPVRTVTAAQHEDLQI